MGRNVLGKRIFSSLLITSLCHIQGLISSPWSSLAGPHDSGAEVSGGRLLKHNRESDMAAMEELMAKKIAVTPLNILFSDPSRDTGYIRVHFALAKETALKVREILAAKEQLR